MDLVIVRENSEGGGTAAVLKIIANGQHLAHCVFQDTVDAPDAGTVSCRLDQDSTVVAYVQIQNAALIRIGWHQ